MSRRMVSGPDLGAGFLWQLSFDAPDDGEAGFTFHLQDGGSDAGGPPIGPPDFLGYDHPESACMFGGPRCWERGFRLPESELGRTRAAYQRTRLAFAALLAHQYEGRAVPFEEGLERFLAACDAPLRSAGIGYRLVGRAVPYLADGGETPSNLRIETEAGGAERIGESLEAELIEPVAARGPEEGFGGRAFLGTFRAGLRLDFGERPPGAGAAPRGTREIDWHGFGVPVAEPLRERSGKRIEG